MLMFPRKVRPEKQRLRKANRKYITLIFALAGLMHFISYSSVRLLEQSAFSEMTVSIKRTTFLLGIFSMTSEKARKRRELIRETILSGDQRVCSLKEYHRQITHNPSRRVCQVPYTFVIGAGGEDRPTDHDDQESLTLPTDNLGEVEEDCTYLNIQENMEEGKSPTYMKFAASIAKEYGLDYAAKTDDDTVVSMPALLEFIDTDLPPSPFNIRTYGGSFVLSRASGNQFMYAQGQFYFMSLDLANHVGNTLNAEDRRRIGMSIEDLDMGLYVETIRRALKMIETSQWQFWYHPKKSEEDFRDASKKVDTLPHVHYHMVDYKFSCNHWALKFPWW